MLRRRAHRLVLLVALTTAFALMSPLAFVGFQPHRAPKVSKMQREYDNGETYDHWNHLVDDPSSWWDNREGKRNPHAPDFKLKDDGDVALWLDSCPDHLRNQIDQLVQVDQLANSDSKRQQWENVISNPDDWWDHREGKRNPRAPDFKLKDDGDVALWLDSCPDHLRDQIDQLDQVDQLANSVSKRQHWEDVISNPDDWWDQRDGKRNPREPDFKLKDGDVALWLDSCPDHLRDQIDQLKQGDQLANSVSKRQHWEDVISNPDNWWDNRWDKMNPRAPDFKLKDDGDVALWLDSCPEDLESQLP